MVIDNFMVNLIIFTVILLTVTLFNLLLIYLSSLLNIRKENRVFEKKIAFIGLYLVAAYLFLNFLSFCGEFVSTYDVKTQDIIFERWLSTIIVILFFVFKIIVLNKKDKTIKNTFPYYFDNKDNKYFVEEYYYNIGKELKIVSYIIALIFSIGQTIFIFNNMVLWMKINTSSINSATFIYNYFYLLNISIIYLVIYELGAFLQGNVKNIEIYTNKAKINKDRFDAMLEEYKNRFKNNILLRFEKNDVNKTYNEEVLNDSYENNLKNDDYIYSKIFTPITEGENIIVETENLYFLADIVPPIINLIFATNRKIAFLTESDTETINTYNWLKKCNVITDNIKQSVIKLTEDRDANLLPDSNIDICIGTIDLLLENRDILNKVDTIFSINIDNIICDSSISLSIMTKIFREIKDKKIQYILFANQQNGLQQTIEAMFYNQNFNYQVVRSRVTNNFHAIFYAKDKGWLQTVVLPGMARESLGSVLPLLITPFKYDFTNLQAFSSIEPYIDEMKELHIVAPNLKSYVKNYNVNEIEDKIVFSNNEHFSENLESMVVAYDDNENNLISLLKNYIKYSQSRILVNIVSYNYLLRDYMIDNIDFLMQNNEFLGKIVPQHIDGDKLLFYKLINELILNYIEEDDLVMDICKIIKYNPDKLQNDNKGFFIINNLKKLIYEIFEEDIHIEPYLHINIKYRTNIKDIYEYNLSERIKDLLPKKLFKKIKFIASDQKAKILKRVPLFEVYQNYAEGQYVVFDGKSYFIDSIDDNSGIVNLIYNDRISNAIYRFKKDLLIEKYDVLNDVKDQFNFKEVEYVKKDVIVNARVTYEGFYEFYNGLKFENGSYKYNRNNLHSDTKQNFYKNHKGIILGFYNDKIGKMNDEQRLKISETLCFIFNEIFKTIFYGLNQYIIVKAITNKKFEFNNEVFNMYSPIILEDFKDSVGLFIMEDTELEKGLLDSFNLKLDTTIIPLITDYIEWVLEEDDEVKNSQIRNEENKENYDDSFILSYNNEKLWFNKNDKTSFLKLGGEKINEIFDLKNTLELLNLINIKGNNSMTIRRKEFKKSRELVNLSKFDGDNNVNNQSNDEINNDNNSTNETNVNNETNKVENDDNLNNIDVNYNTTVEDTNNDKNFEYVDNQTVSGLEGSVCIMLDENNSQFVGGVNVDIFDLSNNLIYNTKTDSNGKYYIELTSNKYLMKVSYPGFQTNESLQIIKPNEITYIEIITLFSSQQSNGNASGNVTNAVNGLGEQGVILKLRKSWNNYDGEYLEKISIKTDKDGNYNFKDVPIGYYTVEATKNGFVKQYNNIEIINNNSNHYDFSINPIMLNEENIRIVLNWGKEPADLDSHLIGRKPSGNFFDVHYKNQKYVYNSVPMVNLDVDKVDSFGPETITITSELNGIYVYGVHDYINKNANNSFSLSYSNCKVILYKGKKIVNEFHIPTNKIGNFWEVFKIDEDKNIIPVNNIYNYNPLDNKYERFGIMYKCNPKYSPIEVFSKVENDENLIKKDNLNNINANEKVKDVIIEDTSNQQNFKQDINYNNINNSNFSNGYYQNNTDNKKETLFGKIFGFFSKKNKDINQNNIKFSSNQYNVVNENIDNVKQNSIDNSNVLTEENKDNDLIIDDSINNTENIENNVSKEKSINKVKSKKKYDYCVDDNVKKEDVIKYLQENIYVPILENKEIPDNILKQIKSKNSKINTSSWNVLSIVNYVLHNTESEEGKKLYNYLKEHNLPCIEDKLNEFMNTFGIYKNIK